MDNNFQISVMDLVDFSTNTILASDSKTRKTLNMISEIASNMAGETEVLTKFTVCVNHVQRSESYILENAVHFYNSLK
jgi:hypothetical protein